MDCDGYWYNVTVRDGWRCRSFTKCENLDWNNDLIVDTVSKGAARANRRDGSDNCINNVCIPYAGDPNAFMLACVEDILP